ncbi:hypothetical protein ACFL2Z_05525 [Candidatus Eisenbacteria bacterium]|uniref:Uncharacterized protein n=1 Tax=Eiseniibacteriota bacterium TaxID=2212470 RepID=A0ABV6YR12_UNCEI
MVEKKTVRKRAGAVRKRKTKPAPKKARAGRATVAKSKAALSAGADKNSERVVVDEIMENDRARILRAPRLPKAPKADLGIDTWGDEVEEAITVWKLEAYVGFKAPRKLKEGDVFFIRDGSDLSEAYVGPKVMARDKAAEKHLIEAAEESREQARNEIKERFYNLTAQRAGRNKKDRDRLSRIIRKRVWKGKR